ncbi:unnamed protein product [Brachionus calyciflorus]|uniref:BZIP domain-containing protein n=1 Tax=Brachionus calyciflorus TaxID=104777 RepID=A0A813MD65_9BILA|nr:unnamed protein product [Brachionus calyciflorus]
MTSPTMTMKLKSIWGSIFQAQNTYFISKSMKSMDSSSIASSSSNEDSSDYRIRREKNNESVRKSRAKNRMKLQECANQVNDLRLENVQLNNKLENLQKELNTLRGLFQHCYSFSQDNLSFEPSEIPTSTLYKLVMNKDLKTKSSTNALTDA